MNKDKLVKLLLIGYVFVFFISLLLSELNIFSSALISMFLFVTFVPYIFGKYFIYKNVNLSNLIVKYACYKSRKIMFKANFLIFFVASLQISYLIDEDLIESIKVFGIVYIFSILINYILSFNKNICVVNILRRKK